MTTNTTPTTPTAFHALVKHGIFTATFVKKDGAIRVMNARCEVKKHLVGGKNTWSPEANGYVSVYDLASKGYRVVNLDTLITLKANGKTYVNPKMQAEALRKQIAEANALLAKLQPQDEMQSFVDAIRPELTAAIDDIIAATPPAPAPMFRHTRYNKSGNPIW